MNKQVLFLVTFFIPLFISSRGVPVRQSEVPYPEGYREWSHVKTGLTGPKSRQFKQRGGFHHIYANETALEGYRSGTFADGSVIVFDVIAMIEKDDGTIAEGERRLVDVMVKNSSTYAATGGWGFEEFAGNSTTERTIKENAASACFSCHEKQKAKDLVFSTLRK